MNIETVLTIVLAVAIATERLVEVVKPLYLKLKNKFGSFAECTKAEKIIMTVLISPVLCIISGIGIDIPGITEPVIVQAILTGLFASIGSNVIHTLLGLVVAFKDAAEGIKQK
jgi:hypothetical protein